MTTEEVVDEFTHQAETFAASSVAQSPRTLNELLCLATPRAGQRWLEVACGPGIISRRLAPEVAEVHGIDVTPAMIDLARREAAAAGTDNVTFAVGDATALEQPDGTFDGVITRFSLHHIPAPGRLRDPSHWACLGLGRLRRLGSAAGLKLRDDVLLGLELDFDDWLARGSGGAGNRDVIERLIADP